MEKHSCKLCPRKFSNGRALGGHMRSHVASATAAARQQQQQQRASCSPPRPASSTSSQDDIAAAGGGGLGYVLRENPRKSFRLVDPEFAAGGGVADGAASSSVVVQDRESETDSPSAADRPKRRRRRSAAAAAQDAEPASSVSDASPDEEVALSLMMLSRDAWFRFPSSAAASADYDGGEEEEEELLAVRSRRSRYQCGTCKKVFRSYQALGGHRASHKKENRSCAAATPPQIHKIPAPPPDDNADKIHECPICFRIFSSGQALGGHKRSHLATATAPPPPPPSSAAGKCSGGGGESFIDLNLPAPAEDDADVSAVSDAEFVLRSPQPPIIIHHQSTIRVEAPSTQLAKR